MSDPAPPALTALTEADRQGLLLPVLTMGANIK